MSAFRWILFFIMMAPVSIFGLWAGLIGMEMTDLVNARLPADQQFPILFSNHRWGDLRRKYRELFPSGDLLKRHDRLTIVMFSSGVLAVTTQLIIQAFSK